MLTMLFCVSLTACSRQIVKTEYIKQQVPELPKEPEYYPVIWVNRLIGESVNRYCLDAENAKNLLKNRELEKGYQRELRKILEQIKGEKK